MYNNNSILASIIILYKSICSVLQYKAYSYLIMNNIFNFDNNC